MDDQLVSYIAQAQELLKKRVLVSSAYFQRALKVGYPMAARIIDQLKQDALISEDYDTGLGGYLVLGKKGLYQKYSIRKTDGSPIDPDAQYFVLRIDTDLNARKAVLRYSSLVSESDPAFAEELYQWVMKYMPADERKDNR